MNSRLGTAALVSIILGIVSVFCGVRADVILGTSTYDRGHQIEAIAGDAPILILVPKSRVTRVSTSSVQIVARKLIDEINLLTGYHSHALFDHMSEKAPGQNKETAQSEYERLRAQMEPKLISGCWVVIDMCHLDRNSSQFAPLVKGALRTKRSKAISLLAKGIVSDVNKNSGFNLYRKIERKINVGIYRVEGKTSNSSIYPMRIDPVIRSIAISRSQVIGGILDELDVIVLPGGSGSAQVKELGKTGGEKIVSFVEGGGGYLGFCAGAYSGCQGPWSDTPSKLNLLHTFSDHESKGWERGGAIAKIGNTQAAREMLPEYDGAGSVFYEYNQGPLMGIRKVSGVENYIVLQRFVSDVHHELPEAKGVMPGKVALIVGDRGKGKVVLSSAHPESTPGMRWMASRMVYWLLGKKGVPFAPQYVRPDQFREEVTFDKEGHQWADAKVKILLGQSLSSSKRMGALDDVIKKTPWKLMGSTTLTKLLNDPDKTVRMAAVDAALKLDHFEYSLFLKEAYVHEKDEDVRKRIKGAIAILDLL